MLLLIWQNVKWLMAYFYMWMTKRKLRPLFGLNHKSSNLYELGVMSPPQSWLKENPRSLLSDKHALDSLSIWGADLSGNVLIIKVSRRHGRISEVYLYLKLKSGEEYVLPSQPDILTYNTDGKSFSSSGLYFEVLEPLRRWRIGFSGILRKGVKNNWDTEEGETISAQFNFVWHPMYNFTGYPLDFNLSMMASLLARQKWTSEFWKSFSLSSTEWYEQWGQMHGKVILGNDEHTLLLTGSKLREYGILNWKTVTRKLIIKGYSENATGLNLYGDTQENGEVELYHGEIHPPSNMKSLSVSQCKVDNMEHFFNPTKLDAVVTIDLNAEKCNYRVKLKLNGPKFNIFCGENWDCQGEIMFSEFELNGKKGFAIIEMYKKYVGGSPLPKQQSLRHLTEPVISKNEELIVTFLDEVCRSSAHVGGKGASLALLKNLKDELKNFEVPSGLCLTKACFEYHLVNNPHIIAAIHNLEDVAWKRKNGNLSDECEKLVKTICSSHLTPFLRDKLSKMLTATFGHSFNEKKFAVRSSAIGEDSEDMSAAGQNDTFLGVRKFNNICDSVLKCWASQFAFRSVEYKRHNGQLLNGGMAVVIQEMVSADVAGVLFSRDPRNGSMEYITITSNYGLGESVVSSAVDPDTIILKRKRNDSVDIFKTTIGKKEIAMVMNEEDGICNVSTDSKESNKCSLTTKLAIRLGKIAILLEKHFGSSRDIEWAVKKNDLFLLQARPVTSNSLITDFEVLHEFDSAMKTANEYYTNGNLAEVMPGASTPLNMSIYTRAQLVFFNKLNEWRIKLSRYDPTVTEFVVMFTNHIFFDVIQQKAADVGQKKSIITKSMEVGFYGKLLDDSEVLKMAEERFGKPTLLMKLPMLTMHLLGLFKSSSILKSMQKDVAGYKFSRPDVQDPNEVYTEICDSTMDISWMAFRHLQVSFASMIWNALLLSLISDGSEGVTTEQLSEFAELVGSQNNCESGDVPFSLKELAITISEEMKPCVFTAMSPQEALTWLTTSNNKASVKFQDFLKRHGHRCLKEFEVQVMSWSMQPIDVVKIVQTMVKHPSCLQQIKPNKTIEDIISSRKSHLSILKKKLLKFVVGLCKNGVRNREEAKSYLISFSHNRRIIFRHLAKQMVNTGYIPDEEILFFMTLEEIGELLQTRSPRIILRARQRKRMFSYMDSLKYPELQKGFPTPINNLKDDLFETTSQVKGVPMCHGVVKGTAKVVLSIQDVDCLEPNDILITHATDIGWSPYFPMLGGVVTEIGGLVSHGAVVAREYGLPCIISAENATRVFKTGDIVLMDATQGIISKVSEDKK